MELETSGSHSMSPDVSPSSSPSSSPPLSPRIMVYSQPQRECRELLTDPDGTNLFRAYLKGAYASEVLNLWVEIQLYKKLAEHDKLRKKGQFIYEKYCCSKCECEVNIDESHRLAVKAAIDNNCLECTTFDNIQSQVFDLLWTDCFMGFRHTETYSNYIIQKNNKPGMTLPSIYLHRIFYYVNTRHFYSNLFLTIIISPALPTICSYSIATHYLILFCHLSDFNGFCSTNNTPTTNNTYWYTPHRLYEQDKTFNEQKIFN
jgi:hypothetical protein